MRLRLCFFKFVLKYSLFQSLTASYFQSVFNMLICLNLFWNANSLFARLETPPDYHTDRAQLGLFPGIQLTSLLAMHLLFMIHLNIYTYLLLIYSLFVIHDKHMYRLNSSGSLSLDPINIIAIHDIEIDIFISKARIGYTLVCPQYYKVLYRQNSTLSLDQMKMIPIQLWLKGKSVFFLA